MTQGLLVVGTDTGVGKTVVACALLRVAVARGRRAVGMKPVAAGLAAGETQHADVAALAVAGNVDAPVAERNPYLFAPAIAPHVAAADVGVAIEMDVILAAYRKLAARADLVVVEAAGGVLVPLGPRHDVLDLAALLQLQVVLVVGLRLGCINHGLLTAQAIASRGLTLAGWIANRIDAAMPRAQASIEAIAERLATPPLADIAWNGDAMVALDRTTLF